RFEDAQIDVDAGRLVEQLVTDGVEERVPRARVEMSFECDRDVAELVGRAHDSARRPARSHVTPHAGAHPSEPGAGTPTDASSHGFDRVTFGVIPGFFTRCRRLPGPAGPAAARAIPGGRP